MNNRHLANRGGVSRPIGMMERKWIGVLMAAALFGGAAMAAPAGSVSTAAFPSDSPQDRQTGTQKITVKGYVADENGEPMIGATVMQAGTKNGTSTDLDGKFSLSVPANATLTVSYVGYAAQTIKVAGRNTIDVKMLPADNSLNDLVVVGYGTMKKRDLTGAISSVKSDIITLTPSSNPMASLQGRVSGLDITQTSGQPGQGVDIQLRGTRSINASGTPLFIIDGMPGNYETINPNDIESIEVLKDASSTAVYGSEGANGVIIITTKKGQAGKMRVNFDAYVGVNGWSTTPKMNTPEQNIFTRQLAREEGGTIVDDAALDDDIAALAAGHTIDWVDAVLGNGLVQNYSLSLSGGTEATQAYFSLNYNEDKGQYKNNNYKVYSSSIRLSTKLNNWLSGGIHVQASYSQRKNVNSRLDDALRKSPFGELYNEDGSIKPFPVVNGDLVNLLLDTDDNVYKSANNNLRLYVQPYLRITPFKGFSLESRLSGNFSYSGSNRFEGYGSYSYYRNGGTAALDAPKEDYKTLTKASKDNSRSWGYQWENIATYNFGFNDIHDFTVTAVSTWTSSESESTGASATSIPSNSMYWTNLGKNEDPKPGVSSSYSMHRRFGLVGRINYSLMGKYLFSASVRRDGDSVLASGYHWATFPAVSAGWRFIDESFMEPVRGWWNNAKLRIGYGETGAAGISPYSSWSILETGQLGLGNNVVNTAYFPQILTNPTLTWERSKSWNFGLDLGFFNNRIDLTLEYYLTNTSDVIWKQSIPSTNGAFDDKNMFQTNSNIAKTRNQGFELTLNTRNIDTPDFTWNSTVTFTTNNEKVVSLGEGASEYILQNPNDVKGYALHIGDPVRSFYSYKFDGIWQNEEAADAAAFGRRPGDMKIEVPGMSRIGEGVWEKTFVGEDGTVTTQRYDAEHPYAINGDDRMIIGHNTPDWTLGFQNTFRYKWFDLSIYMFWRYGQKFYYEPIGWYTGHGGSFPSDFNYWTSTNPSNEFPALDSSREWQKMTGNEALYWVDGGFFKIKNITLGYTLPQAACRKIGISALRLYGTITNPLVVAQSKYLKGYDPEMNGSFNFPLTRQLVFGLNVTF